MIFHNKICNILNLYFTLSYLKIVTKHSNCKGRFGFMGCFVSITLYGLVCLNNWFIKYKAQRIEIALLFMIITLDWTAIMAFYCRGVGSFIFHDCHNGVPWLGMLSSVVYGCYDNVYGCYGNQPWYSIWWIYGYKGRGSL